MRTLLNLLPEGKKEKIQFQLYARFFIWQLFLVFTLEIFFGIVLIGMSLILNTLGESLREGEQADVQGFAQERTLNDYEKKFRSINGTLDVLSQVEMNHLHFTQMFLLLDELLPSGIRIHHLNTNEYTVLITGTADSRENLLELDERLKGSECVSHVNLPISNLFSQKNVAFQMDFDITPECLRKTSL